jgi:hypothetical protein
VRPEALYKPGKEFAAMAAVACTGKVSREFLAGVKTWNAFKTPSGHQ